MGKISSLPDDVRRELIGYLAQPGIIANITAEVPAKKCAEFETKYGVKPYPVNSEHKYGDQYRVYLADPEGCPDVLRDALDQKYGRLNDTVFIRELVDEYGFRFFRPTQDVQAIQEKAKAKGGTGYGEFLRGFQASKDFIDALKQSADQPGIAPVVQLVAASEKSKGKFSQRKSSHILFGDSNAGLSDEQLLHLGWIGEQYFYNSLVNNTNDILSLFGIKDYVNCKITWFNFGYESDSNWTDKSVGKGCDILIQDGARNIYIEVKTSKRKSPVFAMTSFEMQMMQEKKSDFFLVKIDNIEQLINKTAPNVRVFASPFEYFFVTSRMHSAVFYCN